MRESLGNFRLHRWTCDAEPADPPTTVEHRSRGNGPIPLPPGWMKVSVDVETDDGKTRRLEADVCSAKCAAAFVREATTPSPLPAAEAPSPLPADEARE